MIPEVYSLKKKEKIVPIFYLSHHLNNEEIKAWEEKITEEAMTKKDQIGWWIDRNIRVNHY